MSKRAELGPWEPDALAPHCFRCSTAFSIFFRRHHCRRCGRVVCAPCSLARAVLPSISPAPQRICSACAPNLRGKQGGSPPSLAPPPRFSAAGEELDSDAEEEAGPAAARHRAALVAFYAVHRVEYAHAAKVAELFDSLGPSIWLRLEEKYGAPAVAAALREGGAALPAEPTFAGLRAALSAARARDDELAAMQADAEAAAGVAAPAAGAPPPAEI